MTERIATLHGHELAFTDCGTGPAVLFIHGLLGSNRNWAHLVDDLEASHRVVIPDLFGHGASAKPMGDYSLGAHAATLRDLLDRLDIDRVTLVGHSLGGGIAMQFCYLFPERVDRLVLVSSGGLGRQLSPLLRAATLPGAEWVLPVIASPWVRGRLETAGRVVGALGWRAGADVREAWRGFTNDRMIPAWHATSAQQAIAGSRVELFEGAGHFPHLEEPERFAAVLHDFIAG